MKLEYIQTKFVYQNNNTIIPKWKHDCVSKIKHKLRNSSAGFKPNQQSSNFKSQILRNDINSKEETLLNIEKKVPTKGYNKQDFQPVRTFQLQTANSYFFKWTNAISVEKKSPSFPCFDSRNYLFYFPSKK